MRSLFYKTTLFATAALLAGSLAGCIVVTPGTSSKRSAVSSSSAQKKPKKCPPGHLWDDGKCHDTGKGNAKKK
jgi:hypothetical protein